MVSFGAKESACETRVRPGAASALNSIMTNANREWIRVHEPALGEREADALRQCILDGYAGGNSPIVQDFENAFAQWIGADHGVATTSGTTALHLAFATLGIGPGDEVIVPSFTFAPCADMPMLCGAKVVFVDSDPATLNVDPQQVDRAITPATRAVLAVHMFGNPCDMTALTTLCRKRGLRLIEDCAQAIGAAHQGARVGTFGDVSTFSFYPNKHITTGEGGMVLTQDPALADRARALRSHALQSSPAPHYAHDELAYNYRMPAFCAAVGLAQLERLDGFLDRRQEAAARYGSALEGTSGLSFLELTAGTTRHAHWAHVVCLDRPAAPVASALRERHIDTRPLYYPLHFHPAYPGPKPSLPVCEERWDRGLVLPSASTLTERQIERVCGCLREELGRTP
jgi:perosamine synthetase